MSTAFTLYGFLNDDALYPQIKVDTAGNSTQFGVLTGEAKNYLVDLNMLNDSRANRLVIIPNGTRCFGNMSIAFDARRADVAILKDLSDIDIARIFNIVERICYSFGYDDEQLEYQLVNNSSYEGYIANTLTHSNDVLSTNIYDQNKASILVDVHPWYSFEYEGNGIKVKYHFWIHRETFLKEYPYTTITAVLPPYEPNTLINTPLMSQSTNVAMLTDASTFIFEQTHKEMLYRDQTGVYSYKTKYMLGGVPIQLPFGIVYCGAKVPSALECRKAIREYMEANTTITAAEIEKLFPELYIGARFYVIPLWNEKTVRTDRDIYPSIHPLNRIEAVATAAFSEFMPSYIKDKLEIMLNAQSKMWLLTLPDSLNENNIFSVLEQHPSYQDYSSQVPGFRYMDADTQEFAAKLNRCLAVLNEEMVSSEFVIADLGGLTYLTFTSGKAEYYVLSRNSYQEAYGEI